MRVGASSTRCLIFSFAAGLAGASLGQAPQPQAAPGPRRPARPDRKQVLAWADIRNGVQHDSVTRALVTIERLGRESGLYDTYIRTDSQLITKRPIAFPAGTGIISTTRIN